MTNVNHKDVDLIRVLWSVKEDAHNAYRQMLEGSESGLSELGRSIKLLEKLLIERDVKLINQGV